MNIFISISDIFSTERAGVIFKKDHSNVVGHFPANDDPVCIVNNDNDIIQLVKEILIQSDAYSLIFCKHKFEEFKEKYGIDYSFSMQVCFKDIHMMMKTEVILYSIKNMYLFKDGTNKLVLASRYYHDEMNVIAILKDLVLFSKVFNVENLFINEKLNKLIKDRKISGLKDQVLKSKFLSDNGGKLIEEVLIKDVYAFNEIGLEHLALALKNESVIKLLFNFYDIINLEDYEGSISSKFKSYSYIHNLLNDGEYYIVSIKDEEVVFEKLNSDRYSYPTIMDSINLEEKTFLIFDNKGNNKNSLIFNMVTMSTTDGLKLMTKETLKNLLLERSKVAENNLKLLCA